MNWFCPKIELFSCQKRSFYKILCKKKKQSFLNQKTKVLTRAKKCTFFKGVSPWIFSKNRTFPNGHFSQKSYQKRAFLILWKEKNDIKRKNWSFKKGQKNRHFPKGLLHGFCPKIEISLILVFTIIMSENIVFRYLWKKTIIFGPKNWSFNKGQKWTFFKGANSWILCKNRNISFCCFSL